MRNSSAKLVLVWLTLVAFSVQLGVAVLHHHPVKGTGIAARSMTAGICVPARSGACDPSGPIHQDNDGCVLCWAAAIAATSLAPAPAELPAPTLTIASRLASVDCTPHRQLHRDHFQARGPPAGAVA